MFISQIKNCAGAIYVVMRREASAYIIKGVTSTFDLVQMAIKTGKTIEELIEDLSHDGEVDLPHALAEGRAVLPIHHADPAHLHMTGTGLTHLGSVTIRDAMHTKDLANQEPVTDSMRMFQDGLESGKPAAGAVGAQPEWFYKGNGVAAVATGTPFVRPSFAQDAGEEPEVAGIYTIGPDGTPFRVGFAIANEFSDHITERGNYLWLAHSKLRQASFGPEIFVGQTPADVQGASRILRNGKTLWEKPFLSGEDNMSHTIANLEHHHFKYDLFRQPGDLHVHFFGTATLSFADGISTQEGDVFEIDAPQLGLPLRNPLTVQAHIADPVAVTPL